MSKRSHGGLAALSMLRTKLGTASSMEVLHENGYLWTAHFSFGEPTTAEEMETTEAQAQLVLPSTYQQFLLTSNGALLYYDQTYGQWGFQLYGTKDLLKANQRWKKRYEGEWPPSYLAFAESLGDADLLVLDTAHMVENATDCRVLDETDQRRNSSPLISKQ